MSSSKTSNSASKPLFDFKFNDDLFPSSKTFLAEDANNSRKEFADLEKRQIEDLRKCVNKLENVTNPTENGEKLAKELREFLKSLDE